MDDKCCLDDVTAVGSSDPQPFIFRPVSAEDLGLHQRNVVKLVLLGDDLTVLERFRRIGVALLGHEARLFKEWEVDQ